MNNTRSPWGEYWSSTVSTDPRSVQMHCVQHPGFLILQPELSGQMVLQGRTNIPTPTIERYQALYSEVQSMDLCVTKLILSLEISRATKLTSEEEGDACVGCIAKPFTWTYYCKQIKAVCILGEMPGSIMHLAHVELGEACRTSSLRDSPTGQVQYLYVCIIDHDLPCCPLAPNKEHVNHRQQN